MSITKRIVTYLYLAATIFRTSLSGRITQESLINGFNPKGWYVLGDAAYNSNLVRIVPDRQSKRGGFWSTIPTDYSDWEVEFGLHIHGASAVGADGIAFWYTKEPSTGSLFGADELFTGLGVIVDTYDNENSGIHPYMFAINNDGTHGFDFQDHDHMRDHVPAGQDAIDVFGELNGCTAKVRNTKNPVTVKIKYLDKKMTVSYKIDSDEKKCFEIPKISLPKGYFFGFTAATGDLADDHDVTYVKITDLKDTKESLDSYLDEEDVGTSRGIVGNNGVSSAGIGQIGDKLNQMVTIISNAVKSARNAQNAPASMQNARGNTLDNKLSNMGTAVRGVKDSANKLDSQAATIGEIAEKMKMPNGDAPSKNDIQDFNRRKKMDGKPVIKNQPKGPFFFKLFLIVGTVCAVGVAGYYYMMFRQEKNRKLL